jgi:hypothetical protein
LYRPELGDGPNAVYLLRTQIGIVPHRTRSLPRVCARRHKDFDPQGGAGSVSAETCMQMQFLIGGYLGVASPANRTISKGLQTTPLHLYVDCRRAQSRNPPATMKM